MSGSRTYRQYTADDGTNYVISIDRSNADANLVGSNSVLVPPRTGNVPDLPRGLRPRYVLASLEADSVIRRKFYVGGVAGINLIYQPGAILEAALRPAADDSEPTKVRWIITAYRGEKRNFKPAFTASDSGQSDGALTTQ